MRKGAHPEVQLAPQVLINCQGGGTCNGGDPAAAYMFVPSVFSTCLAAFSRVIPLVVHCRR